MIEKLIVLGLRRRVIVWAVFLLVGLYGLYAFRQLPIEAYPDIGDTTSQIVTQVPGLAADEMEQQITIPLERELINTPGVEVLRSNTTFALSLITVVFRDGTDDYWSRQRLQERIGGVELPYGAKAELDPLTSPIGEMYRYSLLSPQRSLRELSELRTWVVEPALKKIQGVAEIATYGGITTQYQLTLDPQRLAKFGLSLAEVNAAIRANNSNAGGSRIDRGEQGFVVRGIGLLRNLDDIRQVVVKTVAGTPVTIGQLGTVELGEKERQGVVGMDRLPDVAHGVVTLLKGAHQAEVMREVHAAVDRLNHGVLPADVKIVPYIDRTELIDATVHTVGRTLAEGMLLVGAMLLLFLGSPRAALIVALTIPLSLLVAFILMRTLDVPANLLSLGAIDFGILVDGVVVVLENILRKREQDEQRVLTLADVRDSALLVGRPVFFATLIIITAYLPLFGFQRVEYKLFSPMAWVVGSALVGALLVALLLIPGLAWLAYRRPRRVFRNPLLDRIVAAYRRVLGRLVGRPRPAVGVAVAALAGTVALGATIGRDFLPYLDEGPLWLQVQMPSGISLDKARGLADELRRVTLENFPEVKHVVTQTGRNDDGTDPWTPSHIEAGVALRPYSEWPSGSDKQQLVANMAALYRETLPGYAVGFTQPMIDGVYDKVAGAHSELVVKVYGDDFDELRRIAQSAVQALRGMRGAVDVAVSQEPPLSQVRVSLDRVAAARHGLNADDVAELIGGALGGTPVTQIYAGDRQYDVTVRLGATSRDDPMRLRDLPLTTPGGAHVALGEVARVDFGPGESTISREMGERHLTIQLNLRGRDLGDFLAEAQPALERLPFDHAGYRIAWGGQFENMQRAERRLGLIVPAALALMFVLLFGEFGNLRHPLLILMTVPLAMLGGLAALHLRGMSLNVSSAVGFIALFSVAAQNGILMVSSLDRWRGRESDLAAAVVAGAAERCRPVLMTATVAALGLLPAALAHGIGSDAQRPLATVVVGGLASATILTLLLLPSLYFLVEKRIAARTRRGANDADRLLDPISPGEPT